VVCVFVKVVKLNMFHSKILKNVGGCNFFPTFTQADVFMRKYPFVNNTNKENYLPIIGLDSYQPIIQGIFHSFF
jgi:hypothetical protein